jgi:ketosteroid isomerase-like protein
VSRENVELVRRAYEWIPDLGNVDPDDLEARLDRVFRDYLDENFEFRLPAGYPEGEPVFRGRNGLVQLAAVFRDAWSQWRFEPERFVDAGESVVVLMRVIATGGASGVPIEVESAHVVTIRDRRIISSRVYHDRSDALKAVGLEE